MTTIVVKEGKLRLEFSKGTGANVGTYSPVVWKESQEVRNPSTGLKMMSEAKWHNVPLYFTNLSHALRWCAQELLDTGEEYSLEGYIEGLKGVWK